MTSPQKFKNSRKEWNHSALLEQQLAQRSKLANEIKVLMEQEASLWRDADTAISYLKQKSWAHEHTQTGIKMGRTACTRLPPDVAEDDYKTQDALNDKAIRMFSMWRRHVECLRDLNLRLASTYAQVEFLEVMFNFVLR